MNAEISREPIFTPGAHSHNAGRQRRTNQTQQTTPLGTLRRLLLMLGLCGVGYYGYTLADQYVNQSYENWTFDQQLAGGTHVSFVDYLRAKAGVAEIEKLKIPPPAEPF